MERPIGKSTSPSAGDGRSGAASARAYASDGEMVALRIRHATAADVDELVALHGRAFAAAHAGVIDDDYLCRRRLTSGETFRREWVTALCHTSAAAAHRKASGAADDAVGGAGAVGKGGSTAVSAPPDRDSVARRRVTLVLEAPLVACRKPRLLGFVAVELAGSHSRRHCPATTQLRKVYLSEEAPRRQGLGTLLLSAALFAAAALDRGEHLSAALLDELCAARADLRCARPRPFVALGPADTPGRESTTMAVWCLSGNAAAVGFYLAAGLKPHGRACSARFGRNKYAYRCFVADDAAMLAQRLACAPRRLPRESGRHI